MVSQKRRSVEGTSKTLNITRLFQKTPPKRRIVNNNTFPSFYRKGRKGAMFFILFPPKKRYSPDDSVKWKPVLEGYKLLLLIYQ